MPNKFILLILPIAALVSSRNSVQPAPQIGAITANPVSKAVFELTNQQTGFIKTGTSRIIAVSGWATHTDKQPPFGGEGVEVLFFTKPIGAAEQKDIVENSARGMKKGDFVAFILFLDKARKIAQVNMTYVVPGTTVARTVASTAQELAKYFSTFQFDGKRLQLKSKGAFSELNAKQESLNLSWDVDIDLPVVERVGK